MISTREKALIMERFWVSLGKYLAPLPSASGAKVNWVNYKTGIKNIQFIMVFEGDVVRFMIRIGGSDDAVRSGLFHQFQKLSNSLEECTSGDWKWEENGRDDFDKTHAVISKMVADVSVYRQEDWPQIISFYKYNILGLDKFWSQWAPAFEDF